MNPKAEISEFPEFPVWDVETKNNNFLSFLNSIHKPKSYTGNSVNTKKSPRTEGAHPTPEELSDWYCNGTTRAERIPIRRRRQALVRAGIPFADADNQAIHEAWTAAKMKGGRK